MCTLTQWFRFQYLHLSVVQTPHKKPRRESRLCKKSEHVFSLTRTRIYLEKTVEEIYFRNVSVLKLYIYLMLFIPKRTSNTFSTSVTRIKYNKYNVHCDLCIGFTRTIEITLIIITKQCQKIITL